MPQNIPFADEINLTVSGNELINEFSINRNNVRLLQNDLALLELINGLDMSASPVINKISNCILSMPPGLTLGTSSAKTITLSPSLDSNVFSVPLRVLVPSGRSLTDGLIENTEVEIDTVLNTTKTTLPDGGYYVWISFSELGTPTLDVIAQNNFSISYTAPLTTSDIKLWYDVGTNLFKLVESNGTITTISAVIIGKISAISGSFIPTSSMVYQPIQLVKMSDLDALNLGNNSSNSGQSIPLGTLIYSNRVTAPTGMVEPTGQILSANQYPDLYNLLTTSKLPYVNIATFDSIVSSYGSCGVYGWDGSSSTFKMMKLANNIYPSTSYSAITNGNNSSATIATSASGFTLSTVKFKIYVQAAYALNESLMANVDLSNLTAIGQAKINLADRDLGNLTVSGEAHFANPSLSNLNSTGLNNVFAQTSLNNITTPVLSGAGYSSVTINSVAGKKFTGPDVVIESWTANDRTGWYRKWKSGWIEQCGTVAISTDITTINFPMPFTTLNYIYNSRAKKWSPAGYYYNDGYQNKQTNSIQDVFDGDYSNRPTEIMWYACGF